MACGSACHFCIPEPAGDAGTSGSQDAWSGGAFLPYPGAIKPPVSGMDRRVEPETCGPIDRPDIGLRGCVVNRHLAVFRMVHDRPTGDAGRQEADTQTDKGT